MRTGGGLHPGMLTLIMDDKLCQKMFLRTKIGSFFTGVIIGMTKLTFNTCRHKTKITKMALQIRHVCSNEVDHQNATNMFGV